MFVVIHSPGSRYRSSIKMHSYKDSAVSCWWDAISCPIPFNCSPSVVIKNIREALQHEGHFGKISIQAYGRPKDLPVSVRLAFQAVFNGHDSGIEMLEKMVAWTQFNPPPASVLLISGSNIFGYALEKLETRGYKIMVVKPISDFESNPDDPWLWKTWETLSIGTGDLFPIFGRSSLCVVEEIFDSLHNLFRCDQPSFTPTKRKPSVVIIFRDEGSETTDTSLKYASYYQKMGLNPTVVCADTSSVVDMLSRDADLAGIPFFGIHTESNLVPIALDEVQRCIESCWSEHDLIIVDISVCFKLDEKAVDERVDLVSEALGPDFVLFAVQPFFSYMKYVFGRSVSDAGLILNIEETIKNQGLGFVDGIISVRKLIVFIQRGNKFEAFDLERIILLILGACNSTSLVADYAIGAMFSYCTELQERFCRKHFEIARDVLVAVFGPSPNDIMASNKVLIAAYRIWCLTTSVYGEKDEDNEMKTSCCDCGRLMNGWTGGNRMTSVDEVDDFVII